MTITRTRVISFDGHAINDGEDYVAVMAGRATLPPVQPQTVERWDQWPLVAGMRRPAVALQVQFEISAEGGGSIEELSYWLSPDDDTPKRLVISDADGSYERYVYAICSSLVPDGNELFWIATFVVHGDVRWRATSLNSQTWEITASGQTTTVNNAGEDDAYPVLTIEPTSGKSGGYTYKRFIPVRWRASAPFTRYPLDIVNGGLDTATLVGAGKMQADGDDLRVLVDGVEADRWLNGINTANTSVWVNLDFQPAWDGTIESTMLSGDIVETIDVNEDIGGAPASGILVIESEVFTYTSKNNSLRRFLGVTRATKGTSAAEHTASTAVWWCQHEVYVLYGNGSVSAPTVDSDYQPCFELASSSNTNWDFDQMGESDGLRAGQWTRRVIYYSPTFYGDTHADTTATTWLDVGIQCILLGTSGELQLYNPCGITNANFQNGEKYAVNATSGFYAVVRSKNAAGTATVETEIAAPSSNSTWEAWSQNEVLASGAVYVSLLLMAMGADEVDIEFSDVTVTLNSSYTPTVAIGAEEGSYSLECEIENETTGYAVGLDYVMLTGQSIEVDTDNKTVTDLADNSNQFQALTLVGGVRRDWLKLQPGNNQLSFVDAGTSGLTVTIEWQRRYF